MNSYYPVSLNLSSKKCTVIGGGPVALRKIKTLIKTNACINVITPQAETEIIELANQGLINLIHEEYQPGLIENSFLVIAATDNRQVNNTISRHCHSLNILVNVVDNLAESSFIVNSAVSQGDLTITISTNGKSPALAAKIREDLEMQYGPEYAQLLQLLAEIRETAKLEIENEERRNNFLRKIVRSDILDLIKNVGIEEAKERVKKCLLSY
ncbi:MAG: precorrin-2 dehydrogenase/sirohydrochlorin ferrochelatase family protein [Bacillota bacterium]